MTMQPICFYFVAGLTALPATLWVILGVGCFEVHHAVWCGMQVVSLSQTYTAVSLLMFLRLNNTYLCWDSKKRRKKNHTYLIGVPQACSSGWLLVIPPVFVLQCVIIPSDVRIENKVCHWYSYYMVLLWETAVNAGSEVTSFHGSTALWTENLLVGNIPSILPQTSAITMTLC